MSAEAVIYLVGLVVAIIGMLAWFDGAGKGKW
jgi:hypothetical protein